MRLRTGVSSGLLTALLAALGCGQQPTTTGQPARAGAAGALLFDALTGCQERSHFVLIDDPFGGREKAGRGTRGAGGLQKMVLLNDRGFFAMPPDREGKAVVIRLAVRGRRELRILLVAGGSQSADYRRTLPAEGRWCDVELPLLEARRVPSGAKIVDITIWQQDTAPQAVLYVQKAWLIGGSPAPGP